MQIQKILTERGANYGNFASQAVVAQTLKGVLQDNSNWNKLSSAQREALQMIMHKAARILNGNPNYADSWIDIAGYAQLIANELAQESKG